MVKFFVKNKFDTGDFLVILVLLIGAVFVGSFFFSQTERPDFDIGFNTDTNEFCKSFGHIGGSSVFINANSTNVVFNRWVVNCIALCDGEEGLISYTPRGSNIEEAGRSGSCV